VAASHKTGKLQPAALARGLLYHTHGASYASVPGQVHARAAHVSQLSPAREHSQQVRFLICFRANFILYIMTNRLPTSTTRQEFIEVISRGTRFNGRSECIIWASVNAQVTARYLQLSDPLKVHGDVRAASAGAFSRHSVQA
jgi:hypothetical protein